MKKKMSIELIATIVLILGVLIGVFGTRAYLHYFNNDDSTVEQIRICTPNFPTVYCKSFFESSLSLLDSDDFEFNGWAEAQGYFGLNSIDDFCCSEDQFYCDHVYWDRLDSKAKEVCEEAFRKSNLQGVVFEVYVQEGIVKECGMGVPLFGQDDYWADCDLKYVIDCVGSQGDMRVTLEDVVVDSVHFDILDESTFRTYKEDEK